MSGRATPAGAGRAPDERPAGDEQRPPATTPGTPGARRLRPGLSRSVVLEAAIDHVDQFGLAELSMRKLGASLGVEGMALYRYVQSRDELLDAMVDRLMDQLYADPQVLLAPEDDWQTFLRKVAAGVRRLALTHPQIFPLIATRSRAAPWIRPPLRSLRWIEGFLAALLSRGFSEDAAVYAYRAFGSFLVGHLLLEASAEGADMVTVTGVGVDATDEDRPTLDLSAFPTLSRLGERLAIEDMQEEFEHSLGNLLERLEEARARLA
ncbi:TetR/AcrR family transcriptional regulator C-terminal domain-containing protein [Cellulomonas aerilata]|uniref:Putative transcriptional regulator, TetR family protein n=1 Tax=Cellulomonas aerilata TaxID=515326 RepID=A0A512D756_9CELL|nr:TetR/AcrR family transcriptional regulator C-terminal domain-containing protein [Cellulomonas aerilata]GEO32313.1 putative transcriptional regulator, TetR family protein [Cellulomonas aerilata]